jgi:Lrp/AsnC family leucine-responsive transcriptional regulator
VTSEGSGDRAGALEDPIDRVLVRALLADGRATFTALAAQTGLSVSAAQARVRRLEARGVLRGYTALVDPEAAGLPLTAFVAITPLDPAAPDDAPERLAALDAVEACHSVAGEESYLLKVRVASPRDLEVLLRQIRSTAGVRTRSTVVLQTFYEARPPRL